MDARLSGFIDRLAGKDPEEAERELRGYSKRGRQTLKYAWPARARPEQVPPGKAVDHVATVEKGEAPSEAEVMNFWKGLTPEERFRYSLAATRDRPYVPIR